MTSITFFIIFVPILSIILLAVNLIFAPHNPYDEKKSTFECGFHSFLGQNRTQFNISFFIFALLFLLFDLEILLIYPYSVSHYTNELYGLMIMLIFFIILTIGFTFEFGKKALKIDSKQVIQNNSLAKSNISLSSNSNIITLLTGFILTMTSVESDLIANASNLIVNSSNLSMNSNFFLTIHALLLFFICVVCIVKFHRIGPDARIHLLSCIFYVLCMSFPFIYTILCRDINIILENLSNIYNSPFITHVISSYVETGQINLNHLMVNHAYEGSTQALLSQPNGVGETGNTAGETGNTGSSNSGSGAGSGSGSGSGNAGTNSVSAPSSGPEVQPAGMDRQHELQIRGVAVIREAFQRPNVTSETIIAVTRYSFVAESINNTTSESNTILYTALQDLINDLQRRNN